MRAICGVMSARTPIIRWETGSISRNVSAVMAAPGPLNSPSSNSISGALTRAWPDAAKRAISRSITSASKPANGGRTSRNPAGNNAFRSSSVMARGAVVQWVGGHGY